LAFRFTATNNKPVKLGFETDHIHTHMKYSNTQPREVAVTIVPVNSGFLNDIWYQT